jgi:hypothetical protein
MGVESVGSTQVVSTQFDAPAALELGASTLVVVANGIASAPLSVTVGSVATVPAIGMRGRMVLCLALVLLGASGVRFTRRSCGPSSRG